MPKGVYGERNWVKPNPFDFLNYLKEHTTRETAEFFSTSESSVGRYARELGYNKPRVGAKHQYKKTISLANEKIEEIKSFWERGYAISQIARLLGLKRHEVENSMRCYGITPVSKKITELSEEAKEEYLSHRRSERYKRTGSPAFSLTEEHKKKLSEFRLVDGYREAHHEIYSAAQKKLIESGHRPFGDSYAKKQSKLNLRWKELLENNGLAVETEKFVNGLWYDLCVGDTLIEINPTYTHNSTKGLFLRNGGKTTPKNRQYHIKKSLSAESVGYRCIHVWDWDSQEKIIQLLLPKKKIGARKLSIKTVSMKELRHFLEDNHLQGFCLGQTLRYGLYLGEELLQVMTFGKSRYSSFEYELLRLCTKSGFSIIGGAEKLYKTFLSDKQPDSVISYCDRSKFSGDVYRKMGFISTGRVSMKHWSKGAQHFTDSYIQSVGPDRAIGTKYGKGVDNASIMKTEGFLEVYDAGQEKFIWKQ